MQTESQEASGHDFTACGKKRERLKKASKSVIENLHLMLTDRSRGILTRSIFGNSHEIPFFRKLFSRATNHLQVFRNHPRDEVALKSSLPSRPSKCWTHKRSARESATIKRLCINRESF